MYWPAVAIALSPEFWVVSKKPWVLLSYLGVDLIRFHALIWREHRKEISVQSLTGTRALARTLNCPYKTFMLCLSKCFSAKLQKNLTYSLPFSSSRFSSCLKRATTRKRIFSLLSCGIA
ncbi:TPA: hypothetical protein DEG20_02705 [candidate division WWE3 bacterium]|nr:hypothetical protein [candidate division WWE3 bacterium]